MFNLIAIALLSLVVSIIIGRFLYKTDLPESLIDKPNNRKIHSIPTPLVGGITIVFSLLIITILYQLFKDPYFQYFLIFAIYFFFIGLFDDLFSWNYKKKLILQLIGIIAFLSYLPLNIEIISFNSLVLTNIIVNYLLIGFWILFIINAFNFFDGINFLAGSLAIVFFISYAIYYSLYRDILVLSILLILIFSIIGFLIYNRAPAKMFLGDAGSMFLGFSLATFPIIFTETIDHVDMTFFIIVVFILISDMIFVMITRLLKNKNPFKPDKTHLHHQLLNLHFRNRYVVLIIIIGAVIHSFLAYYSPKLSIISIISLLIIINTFFIILPRFLPYIFTKYNLWGLKNIYDRSVNFLKAK